MPRHRILGRFCQNPLCRREIASDRPVGTKFCDSSCRSEAWKSSHATNGSKPPEKARRSVPRKAAKPHVPRPPTPYCVMKISSMNGLVPDEFEVVGFIAATRREQAVRELGYGTAEYVAIPMRSLTRFDPNGEPIAEREL